MMNSKNQPKNINGGFTLIELLIVVAIIGLLASVVLVGLGGFRARGRDARRIADIRETQNALELFYTKNNRYPSISGVNSWDSLKSSLTTGGIGVSTIPNDPLHSSDSSKTYEYGVSSDQQNYVLKSSLEDSNNPALTDDVDGTVYSLSCDDPAYCVQF
ncbi:MAG: prepilin-type N-terminal cleavage/methylation domain-containing protein [Candidatus Paceibacterota bacterium]